MKYSRQTRRGFLQYLATVPAALWVAARGKPAHSSSLQRYSLARATATSHLRARVVLATNGSVLEADAGPNRDAVSRLLNNSITALTGKTDAGDAWRTLISPGDIVGIKVNSLAGRGLSSHPELVAAIVDGIAGIGVPRGKIIVWDRMEDELLAAGFSSKLVGGAEILGTDSPGAGYERGIEFSGQIGSCFSRIISRMCTAIINVPVLKDHDLSGVSLGMKNFYGAIHNPNKYHDNNCNPYIADVNAHPFVSEKLRLVVCDALKAQYHGGPAFCPQWSWPAATLLVGADPVAVDRVALEMIEQKRHEVGMDALKDIGREPRYIKTASDRGLGEGELERITKVRIS